MLYWLGVVMDVVGLIFTQYAPGARLPFENVLVAESETAIQPLVGAAHVPDAYVTEAG